MATRKKKASSPQRTATTDKASENRGQKNKLTEVAFDYIKANFFRVVHADGAFGGITPQGYLHMALYSERRALPKQMVYSISKDGTIGPEMTERRDSRNAIVREVECDVILDERTMRSVHKWLGEKIEELQQLKQVAITAQAKGRQN
jgi:hypothetical protein